MRRISQLVAVAVVLVGNAARASDRTGIYAIIDSVTIESKGEPEETIALRGLFSLAKGRRDYAPPVYGQMFFRLTQGKEAACRKEWADFQRVAGTGECIAFARRYGKLGRVRKPKQPLDLPDRYSVNVGLRRIRPEGNYTPIKRLVHVPRPSAPHDGATVSPGRVELVAGNISAKKSRATYFFEIEDKSGRKETSPPVAAGARQTRWTPKMAIEPGGTYTWRVWVVAQIKGRKGGKPTPYTGPVAAAQFTGKKGK